MNEYNKKQIVLVPRYKFRFMYLLGALRSIFSFDPLLTLCECCKWKRGNQLKRIDNPKGGTDDIYLCKKCYSNFNKIQCKTYRQL